MQEEAPMPTRPNPGPRHLQPHEVLHIHDGAGLAVKCVRGVLWITQSNDTDDIVVRTGETFVLDRNGLALVSAPIGPADLVVEAVQDRAGRERRERAMISRRAA
jgi:hypothetical protein